MNIDGKDIIANKSSLDSLGDGGFGEVYKISSLNLANENEELAIKLYKPKAGVINVGAFQSLINVREKLKQEDPERCKKLDSMFTWPLALLTEEGYAKGIVMNIIPEEYFGIVQSQVAKGKRIERNLGHIIDDGEISGWGPVDLDTKLEILYQIAYALAFLHKLGDDTSNSTSQGSGIVYGDISPSNILYSLDGDPKIMFIDCDSVRKVGAQAPTGKQAHTAGWEPPEAKLAQQRLRKLGRQSPNYKLLADRYHNEWSRQTRKTDVYKFGLLFLRVIDSGRDATSRSNPTNAKRKVSPSLGRLLDASLSENPNSRPSMKDWVLAFNRSQTRKPSSSTKKSDSFAASYIRRIDSFGQLPSGEWTRLPPWQK